MKKLLFCLFLCLLVGIFPVFASTIAFPHQMVENTLFFLGTYEERQLSWTLLGNYAEDAPLAVCQYVFPEQAFSANGTTDYAESDLRAYLDGTFYETVFSPHEKTLITEVGTTDFGLTDWLKPYPIPSNQGFYLFPLSAMEARKKLEKYNSLSGISFEDGTTAGYWLRSAHQSIANACGIVRSDNTVSSDIVTDSHGVRPAFRLDFSSIIFVRKALDEDYGEVGLVTKSDFNRSGEYKFSLLKDSLSFIVQDAAYDPKGKLSVSYKNASVEDNTYVSAIILAPTGEIRAYGRMGKLKKSAGTIVSKCDFDLMEGDYSVQFFLEQPDKNSQDFVSRPTAFGITVKSITTPIPLWFWFIPGLAVLIIVVAVVLKKKKSK